MPGEWWISQKLRLELSRVYPFVLDTDWAHNLVPRGMHKEEHIGYGSKA